MKSERSTARQHHASTQATSQKKQGERQYQRDGAVTIHPALMAPIGRVSLAALDARDWKRQLSDFIHQYGRRRSNDFQRLASEETLRNRHDIIFATVRDVMAQDKNLRSLSQIKPRLLPKMFAIWDQKGISKRAQINYFNQMRWFWRVCGIEVEPINQYAKYEGEFTINRNAERDKSWSGNGVDFDEVYSKALEMDPVGARLIKAMYSFGLRPKEALRLNPHESDAGDALHLMHGTKTGKPRSIRHNYFGEEELRAVVDELKGQVPKDSHLAWQNLTLKQAKQRLSHLARKLGLTKKDLGVTLYGARHEFAIRHLQEIGGSLAPVRGGVVLDYRRLSEARKTVAEAMGHHRPKITGAYYGSFLSLERDQLRKFDASWARIEPVMNKVGALLSTMEINNLYWIGLHAVGAGDKATPYDFVLPPGVDTDICAQVCKTIAESVESDTGYECRVVPWESMPTLKQQLAEENAIPVFAAVSPSDYFTLQMAQQRQARAMLKRPQDDAK